MSKLEGDTSHGPGTSRKGTWSALRAHAGRAVLPRSRANGAPQLARLHHCSHRDSMIRVTKDKQDESGKGSLGGRKDGARMAQRIHMSGEVRSSIRT